MQSKVQSIKPILSVLLLAATVCTLSPAVEAAPRFGSIESLRPKAAVAQADTLANCTNFSGSWVGQCVDSNGTVDKGIQTIVQTDCARFELDGSPFDIPGTQRIGTSSASGVMDIVYVMNWNSSRTAIEQLVTLSQSGPTASSVSVGRLTWTIEDGKLHTTQKMNAIGSHGKPEIIPTLDCTYDKAL